VASSTLRPLSIGEILDAGIKVVLRHWKPLMTCIVGLVAPVWVVYVLLLASIDPDSLELDSEFSTGSSTTGDLETAAIVGLVVTMLLLGVTFLVAFTACFKAVSDAWLGASPEVGRSLRFGLKRSPKSEGPTAYRVYMSDGEINLALLQYKSEVGSGLKNPNDFVGIHHFGFQCDDLPKQQAKIEKAGGKFFFDLGDPDDDDFERKFKDPNGIIFDINWKGWTMTSGKVKAKPATKRAAAAKKVAKKTAKPKAKTARKKR